MHIDICILEDILQKCYNRAFLNWTSSAILLYSTMTQEAAQSCNQMFATSNMLISSRPGSITIVKYVC